MKTIEQRTLAALALATLGAATAVGSAAAGTRPPYLRSDSVARSAQVLVLPGATAVSPCSEWRYLQARCQIAQGKHRTKHQSQPARYLVW